MGKSEFERIKILRVKQWVKLILNLLKKLIKRFYKNYTFS